MMIIVCFSILYLAGAFMFSRVLLVRGRSHHPTLYLPWRKIIAWSALWLPIMVWVPLLALLSTKEP